MKLIRNKLIIKFGELEDLYLGFKDTHTHRRANVVIIIPKEAKE